MADVTIIVASTSKVHCYYRTRCLL